ncbi:Tho complex subunit 7-domain-containing protein [Annulohypoxylon maeteangense]|uniref:Tho complex subunit 7-domain-containing protein n=1 Tax=Annulohypoxylon maeteangense TaxID=1927788 RepID=UPI0020081366|nr:Tho complex subunit 7-domain-containing protein [Annulohypoxylon maeteangense]KAI0889689.1 Tho complex subunit 7-domain-containing protein [Annulohypoxylon maeteangense]
MASQHFGLLEEREENELHKTRLLNVEEKSFKRLIRRLVHPSAFTSPAKLLTPPPDSTNPDAEATPAIDITSLKEDITLDFEAFDAQILRLQFLDTANTQERERYAADRVRIMSTMESVRDGNARLKTQLEEARATLAQRRKFDELADKITSNRMLRPRAEQAVNLAKLAEECDELYRESENYGHTWRERREQFERLVEEGKRLRALIRDEKEEVERREGMDSDAEDGEAAVTPGKAGLVSGNATPRPDSGAVSAKGDAGGATPLLSSRDGRTPRPDSPGGASAAVGAGSGLKPRLGDSGDFSRAGSQAPSLRAGSQQPRDDEPEEGEDIEMSESGTQQNQLQGDTPMAENESQETPQITVEAPDGMDTS